MNAKNSHSRTGLYFIGLKSKDEKHVAYPLFRFETVYPLMEHYTAWMEFASMLQMEDELVVGKYIGRGEFENLTADISQFVVLDEVEVLEEKYLGEK